MATIGPSPMMDSDQDSLSMDGILWMLLALASFFFGGAIAFPLFEGVRDLPNSLNIPVLNTVSISLGSAVVVITILRVTLAPRQDAGVILLGYGITVLISAAFHAAIVALAIATY